MNLFNRNRKAREKWHKKAVFVDPSKVKIVFEKTGKPKKPRKPKRLPSWLYKNHPAGSSFSTRNPNITLRITKKEAPHKRA